MQNARYSAMRLLQKQTQSLCDRHITQRFLQWLNPPRQPFCDMPGCLPKATRWCENRCAWPSLLLSYGLCRHMTLRRLNRCEYAYPARVEEDATKILKANIAERCKDFEMPALSVSDKPRNVCRTYRKMWHPTCSSQYLNLFCPD